jgi:hypothetical protein
VTSLSRKASTLKPAEILYRAFVDELRFAKQQQWTITNYVLLVMAAVFAVAKLVSPLTTWEKSVGYAFVALAWILGLFVLFDLQWYMGSIRKRQTGMEQTFSPQDQSLAQPGGGTVKGGRRLGGQLSSKLHLGVMCLVVTLAGFLAGYAIWLLPIASSRGTPDDARFGSLVSCSPSVRSGYHGPGLFRPSALCPPSQPAVF